MPFFFAYLVSDRPARHLPENATGWWRIQLWRWLGNVAQTALFD
jgi:hypothetical protein